MSWTSQIKWLTFTLQHTDNFHWCHRAIIMCVCGSVFVNRFVFVFCFSAAYFHSDRNSINSQRETYRIRSPKCRSKKHSFQNSIENKNENKILTDELSCSCWWFVFVVHQNTCVYCGSRWMLTRWFPFTHSNTVLRRSKMRETEKTKKKTNSERWLFLYRFGTNNKFQ